MLNELQSEPVTRWLCEWLSIREPGEVEAAGAADPEPEAFLLELEPR